MDGSLLLIFIVAFIGLAVWDAISSSCSVIYSICRSTRSKIRGTRYIRIPEVLQTPITNNVIDVGSELIVGAADELQGVRVIRYAIAPQVAKQDLGTILRIDSISKDYIEIYPTGLTV